MSIQFDLRRRVHWFYGALHLMATAPQIESQCPQQTMIAIDCRDGTLLYDRETVLRVLNPNGGIEIAATYSTDDVFTILTIATAENNGTLMDQINRRRSYCSLLRMYRLTAPFGIANSTLRACCICAPLPDPWELRRLPADPLVPLTCVNWIIRSALLQIPIDGIVLHKAIKLLRQHSVNVRYYVVNRYTILPEYNPAIIDKMAQLIV